MEFLGLRDPVSALTHGFGLVLALVGVAWLWRRTGPEPAGRVSVLIYSLSLVFCYAASTLFHTMSGPIEGGHFWDRLDRIGIFGLIAGTYTPLAIYLLRGGWRRGTLAAVWGIALVASAWLALVGALPGTVTTGLYLAMGWGVVACFGELSRSISGRGLRLLVAGGVLYSVGAVLNALHWPTLWPGVFGPHDLFHLFVIGGSLCHFLLILMVAGPAARRRPRLATSRPPARREPAGSTASA